jgi:hypothetical protein
MNEIDPTGNPYEANVTAAQARRFGIRRRGATSKRGWIAVTALVCAAIGVTGYAAASSSTTATSSSSKAGTTPAAATGRGAPASGGSNARSGPAAGGSTGTVSVVATSGFTVTTSAGQKVTVKEAPSTTYAKGSTSASASAVTTGETVLVLGTTNGTTITATQVVVQPNGGASATSSAVVPFQRGAPSTAKQVGQIPANYSQGSGTIVSGTAANKATEAALAAYPGGVVDRVVQLSNGEYEVHNIGVNWPHHIFVDQSFKVVGAN